MSKLIDLTGQKFGRLTVIERAETKTLPSGQHKTQWLCECDCPEHRHIVVMGTHLKNGHTQSCGCFKQEVSTNNKTATTHGMAYSRLYYIWNGMKRRKYGDRRIPVCDEWQTFEPFCEWSLSNGYADNLTIDRIDGTKGYSPDNCRWATRKIQQNNRRNNHLITYNGETHTTAEWAEIKNINYKTLMTRLWRGWSNERALNTP